MSVVATLQRCAIHSLTALSGRAFTEKDFQVNQTKPEFEGDYTIVLFSLAKSLPLSPETIGKQLGDHLIASNPALFTKYNIIKGFLNLSITDTYWLEVLDKNYNNTRFGQQAKNGKKVMVEYSSPNTNKPLHLGHLRNNFLGWSVAEIFKAAGFEVIKSCIVNDRGIHICKSMIAWQLFADGATPASTHTKGDHFVGDYYVRFNDEYKIQIEKLKTEGFTQEAAENAAPIMKAAQQMLSDWEAGKPSVLELWATMNGWVYAGFDTTYKKIGSDFDITYYESNTYLLGKKIVAAGLQKNIFYTATDNSVWIDLTADGLDKKIVQRRDGTSVYITQDIGLAQQKYEEYAIDRSIYVIGDEQNYHMNVLKLIAEKLQMPNAESIYHLSYGLVELPTGKMKSREGTVVDADDIVAEMEQVAQKKTEELGKVSDFTSEELTALYHSIGLGALKFFLLRIDPKKKMIFNPEESIDFHGFTGPFIQFNYARIQSILRKSSIVSGELSIVNGESSVANSFLPLEKELIVALEQYPTVVQQACDEMNPSALAIYVYNIAKTFSSFYTAYSIANAETANKKQLRLQLAGMAANVMKSGMQLLGITVPERM
jgi:arginyl-tRNA synthetase